jgi:hypothetical protein
VGLTDKVRIDRQCSQTHGGPMRNSSVLAASRAGGQKGDGGGVLGPFIDGS